MRDMPRLEIRTYHKKYDPSAVAEEIERLYVTRIVIAAAFVKGDEDHRVFRIPRRFDRIHNFLAEALEQVELRGGRMAVNEAARFNDGNGRERAVGDVAVEIRGVLDMRFANGIVSHDRRVVLERIADGAIFVGSGDLNPEWINRAHGPKIDLVGVAGKTIGVERGLRLRSVTGSARVVVPVIAVIFPGDVMGEHIVTDARQGRRGNRKNGVRR